MARLGKKYKKAKKASLANSLEKAKKASLANSLGIALIEILISTALIALVLLALLTYQLNTQKSLTQTNLKTIATTQLMNFSDMLRAPIDRNAALTQWNQDNAKLLPQGSGTYTQTDSHTCKITVNWFFKTKESQSISVFC